MENKKLSLSKLMPFIGSALLLVIGILFCFEKLMGEQAISCILGVSLMLFGLIRIIYSAIVYKSIKYRMYCSHACLWRSVWCLF